ncbi:MAG: hypothetical protein L3J07_04230 [Candidatus Magasanikbacteria bacterium]|nr:hypothetical protein [Candidatus Magasanikbacteria bacterium]
MTTKEEFNEINVGKFAEKYNTLFRTFFIAVIFILLLLIAVFFAPNPFFSIFVGTVMAIVVLFVGSIFLLLALAIQHTKNI